jgi:excisionase family DNA binding protein
MAARKRGGGPCPGTLPLPFEPISVRIPVAVRLTGISRSKLYELIRDGELKTVKIGASTLVRMESLKRLIGTGA